VSITSKTTTLTIWDVESGKEKKALKGHTGGITGFSIFPNSKWIVSASDDKTLKIWDVESGKVKNELKNVSSFSISPDSKWIVSASDDKILKIWDVENAKEKNTFNHGETGGITGLSISPDSKWIVSVFNTFETDSNNGDYTLKFWDVENGKEKNIFRGGMRYDVRFSISPDSKWIVILSDFKILKIWDVESGKVKNELKDVSSFSISPDSKWIVITFSNKTCKVFDFSGVLYFNIDYINDQSIYFLKENVILSFSLGLPVAYQIISN